MMVSNDLYRECMKGTTTVGLICKDGVVLATDKRATMGNLVADKEAKKLYKIDDYIAMTIAGSVGDAQALVRWISAEAKLYRLRSGNHMPPHSCAVLLSNILHGSRYFPFLTQLLVGGYDNLYGPKLFSLDLLGGINEETSFTATGSGSPTALGVLESEYRRNMTVKKGRDLAVRALISAMERDAYSGNGISLGVIDKNGVKIYSENEVNRLINRIRKRK